MMQLTRQSKILLASKNIDTRKDTGGLAAIYSDEFQKDSSSSNLFVVVRRARGQV